MNYESYLIAALPCIGAWAVIFCSPLLTTIASVLIKQTMTSTDLEDWLISRRLWWWFKLYTCVWCQAWWTSFAAALAHAGLTNTPWMIPVTTLGFYPVIAFIVWKIHHLPNP